MSAAESVGIQADSTQRQVDILAQGMAGLIDRIESLEARTLRARSRRLWARLVPRRSIRVGWVKR